MAAIVSNTSGVWSNTSVWLGGVVPIEGDTVRILNGHTVTLNQSVTVGADSTTAAIDVETGGKLEYPSAGLSTASGATRAAWFRQQFASYFATAHPAYSFPTYGAKLVRRGTHTSVKCDGGTGYLGNGTGLLPAGICGDIDFTWCGWVYLTDKAASYGLLGHGRESTNTRVCRLRYDTGTDRFVFDVSANGTTAASGTVSATDFGSPTAATWYFIEVYHDSVANQIGIRVNNGTATTASYSGGVYATGSGGATISIGNGYYGSTPVAKAQFEKFAYWRRILTSTERAHLYNSGTGRSYCELTDATVRNEMAAWYDLDLPGFGGNAYYLPDAVAAGRFSLTSDVGTGMYGAGGATITSQPGLGGSDTTGVGFGDEDFSFSCWVRLDALYSEQCLFSRCNPWAAQAASSSMGYYLRWNGTQFYWYVNGASVSVTPAGMARDTWYHLVVYHDATANLIGIVLNNGTPVTAALTGGNTLLCRMEFAVGSYANSNGWPGNGYGGLIGQIKDLGCWGRKLTAGEITSLYNSGTPKDWSALSGGEQTGARAYWNMHEVGGSTRADSSSNAYDLECIGTVDSWLEGDDIRLVLKGDLKQTGGNIEFGTVANPIPSANRLFVMLNYSATMTSGKYGWIITAGDTTLQGNPLSYDRTTLGADIGINPTSANITTTDSTGWKVNDLIVVSSTSQMAYDLFRRTLPVNASSTTVTLGTQNPRMAQYGVYPGADYISAPPQTLSGYQSGPSPVECEIINLTRNLAISSFPPNTNGLLHGWIRSESAGTFNADWVEFCLLGQNTALKYGALEYNGGTLGGTVDINRCAIHDCGYGIMLAPKFVPDGYTFTCNLTYNVFALNLYASISTAAAAGDGAPRQFFDSNIAATITHNWSVGGGSSSGHFSFPGPSINVGPFLQNFCDNRGTSGSNVGFQSSGVAIGGLGTFERNVFHSNGTGASFNGASGVITDLTAYRNLIGVVLAGVTSINSLVFNRLKAFGNSTYNASIAQSVLYYDCDLGNDPTASWWWAFNTGLINTAGNKIVLRKCRLGTTSLGGSTLSTPQPDGSWSTGSPTSADLLHENCYFSLANPQIAAGCVGEEERAWTKSTAAWLNINGTASDHYTERAWGNLSIDTGTIHSSGPSERVTPTQRPRNVASSAYPETGKARSSIRNKNVLAGSSVSFSVWVRKSSVDLAAQFVAASNTYLSTWLYPYKYLSNRTAHFGGHPNIQTNVWPDICVGTDALGLISDRTTSFSIAGWVWLDSKSASRSFVSKDGPAGTTGAANGIEYRVWYDASTDRFSFTISNADGQTVNTIKADTLGSPSTGQWYFIVASVDLSGTPSVSIEVDRGTADSMTKTVTCFSDYNPLNFGKDTSNHYHDGRLARWGMWRHALTTTEKNHLYNSGSGRSYNQITLYSLVMPVFDGTLVAVPNLAWFFNLNEHRGTRFCSGAGTGGTVAANGSQVNLMEMTTVGTATGLGGYTGNQPRLMASTDYAVLGDTASTDIVIDTMTASNGTWEQLSGVVTANAATAGVVTCYVDCDGDTGYINVDDWA